MTQPATAAWILLKAAARLFRKRGGRLLSGAIAFYALLSVVPMLVIVLHVVAGFSEGDAARAFVLHELGRWVGPAGAATVGELLDRTRHEGSGTVASVLSSVFVLYGSTRLWSQMQRALDILWGVEKPESSGWKGSVVGQLRKRGLAFLLVVFTGLALSALLVGHTLLARLRVDDVAEGASRVLEGFGSLAVTAGLFTLMFRFLPHAEVTLKEAFRGGLVTAILLTLGSLLVSAYVAHKAASSAYGTATSLVMLLLYVHYSAHVFFFGAALTCVQRKTSSTLEDAPDRAILDR